MKTIHNKKDAIRELKRISSRTNSDNNNKINLIVQEILQDVKNNGDRAVINYEKERNIKLKIQKIHGGKFPQRISI